MKDYYETMQLAVFCEDAEALLIERGLDCGEEEVENLFHLFMQAYDPAMPEECAWLDAIEEYIAEYVDEMSEDELCDSINSLI